MQICLRNQIKYYFNQKIENIRYIQRELSSQYLYKEERENYIKELDDQKADVRDQINFLIGDLEIINGEFNNLF